MQPGHDGTIRGLLQLSSASATFRRTRRLPRALGRRIAKKDHKYNCVVLKVTNIHQANVNEHDES